MLNCFRASLAITVSLAASQALAGPTLPPPGPVAPTMKTLEQVEPRIPIGPDTTPGDADSVFKITQPGSYYLTADVLGEPGKHGIEVAFLGNSVATIDLGGYTLRGVGGSLNGLRVSSGTFVAKNGIVQGWGADGVSAVTSASGSYQDIIAVANAGTGFDIARGSTLQNCVARNNARGFNASACAISNCVAYGNTGKGFELRSGCALTSCTAHQNDGLGYESYSGTLVGCTADNNAGNGFQLYSAEATGCVSQSNLIGIVATNASVRACTVVGNAASGIQCDGNSLIAENNVRFNGRTDSLVPAAGILVSGSNNRIDGNNVNDTNLGGNDYGIWVSGTGNFVVRNTCSNNSTNFSFAAANTTGPVITAVGNIATTSPWANFEF